MRSLSLILALSLPIYSYALTCAEEFFKHSKNQEWKEFEVRTEVSPSHSPRSLRELSVDQERALKKAIEFQGISRRVVGNLLKEGVSFEDALYLAKEMKTRGIGFRTIRKRLRQGVEPRDAIHPPELQKKHALEGTVAAASAGVASAALQTARPRDRRWKEDHWMKVFNKMRGNVPISPLEAREFLDKSKMTGTTNGFFRRTLLRLTFGAGLIAELYVKARIKGYIKLREVGLDHQKAMDIEKNWDAEIYAYLVESGATPQELEAALKLNASDVRYVHSSTRSIQEAVEVVRSGRHEDYVYVRSSTSANHLEALEVAKSGRGEDYVYLRSSTSANHREALEVAESGRSEDYVYVRSSTSANHPEALEVAKSGRGEDYVYVRNSTPANHRETMEACEKGVAEDYVHRRNQGLDHNRAL